jgi:Sec-independent protein translocase protein TatA
MFGIGPQELVVIVFLILIVFGPGKAGNLARDLGRWVNEARSSVEEFKEELNAKEEPEEEPPEPVEGAEKPNANPAQKEDTSHQEGATAK